MSQDPQQPTEVLINDTLYDVAGFNHPGGSIVKFMMGSGDATEAFNEFHIRSSAAQKLMKTLPNRPLPAGTKGPCQTQRWKALSEDYVRFRSELIKEGFFDWAPMHTIYRFADIFLLHALGLYLLLNTSLWFFGLVILGIAQGRCGWLMHEGGHGSMLADITIDRRFQEFLFCIGCGMSAGWWRVQHNKHHACAQKLGHDVDLDTLPFIAFNAAIAKAGKKNPLIKTWLSYQNFTFAPISCTLVALGWQLFLHPRYMIRTGKVWEAILVLFRYVIVAYLMHITGASLLTTVLCYLLYDCVGGTYIFTNFALNHSHLGVTQPNEHVHWLTYASDYTINVCSFPFTNWWMGYLNFQIEHHLFPCMPQYRFVEISPRTKAFFERNGLRYEVRPYFTALHDTFSNLAKVAAAAAE